MGEAAITFSTYEENPSEFQRVVFAVVQSLGLFPVEEVTSSLGYSLDMVVRVPLPDECPTDDLDDLDDDATGGGRADCVAADAGVFPGDSASNVVAIEVDGPTHFIHRSMRPVGATIIKRRQLQQAGWRLVSVPYFEWRDAARYARNRDERDVCRRRYLADRIGIAWDEQPVDLGTDPGT